MGPKARLDGSARAVRSGERAFALTSVLLVSCASAPEPSQSPSSATAMASVVETPASASAKAAPLASEATPAPISTGPSRETLCEKALFDLESAAAPVIDKCLGPRLRPQGAITVDVEVDDAGKIRGTKWDPSTTTGLGEQATKCVLVTLMTIPFDEPACAGQTLLVRRAPANTPNPLDVRL